MTPDDLAAELGYDGGTIRAWLRTHRPRAETAKGSPWDLTSEGAAAVRQAFVTRGDGCAVPLARRAVDLPAPSTDGDWYWEGNVQATVARHLKATGWSIKFFSDTARRQHGDDIRAWKDGRTLRIEVKGWPTKGRYADPRRTGEVKRANPSTQAAHWYGQAILHVIRCLDAHPQDEVAIALPEWPRFRSLVNGTETGLRRLGVGLFFVSESGQVEVLLPHGAPAGAEIARPGANPSV